MSALSMLVLVDNWILHLIYYLSAEFTPIKFSDGGALSISCIISTILEIKKKILFRIRCLKNLTQ